MTSSIFMVPVMNQLSGTVWKPVGTLFTVDGTAYPGAPFAPWPYAGFASDIAWGLMTVADGMWLWNAIEYPAAVVSMQKSVNVGRANLVNQILQTPLGWPITLAGYSQGACVTDQCWLGDFLAADGVLHDRYLHGDLKAIFNFGDPQRCPGVANGNLLASIPIPGVADGQVTGGIAGPGAAGVPADLTAAQTPPFLYSYALPGDLYASCPVGVNPWKSESKVGKVETNIYHIIMKPGFWNVIDIAKDLFTPVATVEAIANGLTFAAAGMNAPHWQYGPYVGSAVGRMLQIGLSLPHGVGV